MNSGFHEERKPLRMVACDGCGVKNFISPDIPPLGSVACTRCGYPILMPMQLRQYELRAIVGSGGMGTVYRAFDTTLGRDVAVKLMRMELVEDEAAIISFSREARAIAALNHTNIIHIYTFDEHEGHRFLVMELADRGSLDSKIEKFSKVTELEILDIGYKIASALSTALKRNLLHRDIKPGNILFNADNEPKLIDFGLACKAEDHQSEQEIWGTPYYIAPEKVRREGETFHSDMYSLAATLYHGITGHVPFEATTAEEVAQAHATTPLTPPNQVNPEITQATSDVLAKAMSKKPQARFETYEDFSMAIEAARSQLLVSRYRNQSGGGKSWWR